MPSRWPASQGRAFAGRRGRTGGVVAPKDVERPALPRRHREELPRRGGGARGERGEVVPSQRRRVEAVQVPQVPLRCDPEGGRPGVARRRRRRRRRRRLSKPACGAAGLARHGRNREWGTGGGEGRGGGWRREGRTDGGRAEPPRRLSHREARRRSRFSRDSSRGAATIPGPKGLAARCGACTRTPVALQAGIPQDPADRAVAVFSRHSAPLQRSRTVTGKSRRGRSWSR